MPAKTKWIVNSSKSEIFFEVEHYIMPDIKGEFKIYNSKIITHGNDFMTNEINLCITSSSIKTGDKYCDEQLKSELFFDVENHKHIFFNGSTILRSDNKNQLLGNLTIKGITSTIRLNVEFDGIKKNIFGNEKANFTITGTLNRNDWGLNLVSDLEAWQILVSDKVKINCKLQLKKSTIQDFELPMIKNAEEERGIYA